MGSSGSPAPRSEHFPPNVKSDIQLIEEYRKIIEARPADKFGHGGNQSYEIEVKDRGLLSKVQPLAEMDHMSLVYYHGWLIYRSLEISFRKRDGKMALGMDIWDAYAEHRIVENERRLVEEELLTRMPDVRLLPIIREMTKTLLSR